MIDAFVRRNTIRCYSSTTVETRTLWLRFWARSITVEMQNMYNMPIHTIGFQTRKNETRELMKINNRFLGYRSISTLRNTIVETRIAISTSTSVYLVTRHISRRDDFICSAWVLVNIIDVVFLHILEHGRWLFLPVFTSNILV
jgi:hypothetical protein